MAQKDRRTVILKAARDMIAENGFHNSPIAAIAKKAGVSVGTMYRYFKNKDILIDAVYNHEDEKMNAVLLDGDSEKMPVRERFIRIFTRFIEYMQKDISVIFFMEQYYHSPYGIHKKREELAMGTEHCEPLALLLMHAKQQQIVKNLDNELLFDLCFAPLVFLLKDQSEGLIDFSDDLKQQAVEMSWNAIKM